MTATQAPLFPEADYKAPLKKHVLPIRDQPLYRVATNAKQCSLMELMVAILAGRKKDPSALAQAVLDHFNGDVTALSRATVATLMPVEGMTEQAAAALVAALTLGERIVTERSLPPARASINSPADAAALLVHEMGGLEKEEMRVILLDARSRVMGVVTVYQGSVNASQVRVGELFTEAIRRQALSIILAHNHPSSDPSPSPDDVAVTRAAVQAGKLLDIIILDHLVIGGGRFVSLKERGLGFS